MEQQHLKLLASSVRTLLQNLNRSIKHGQSLDLVAAVPGLRNWPEVLAFPDRVANCDYDAVARERLARRIRRDHGVDVISTLPELSECNSVRSYSVFLTAFWHVRARKEQLPMGMPRVGRETLELLLDKPLTEILARHQLRGRGLHRFRMEYRDHLEQVEDSGSMEDARKHLLEAARTLRFLSATGLRPATSQRHLDRARIFQDFPKRDHTSHFVESLGDGWVCLDEPYAHIKSYESSRQEWAGEHGLHVLAPEWGGLYYPGKCFPYLISPDLKLLTKVAGVVEALGTYEGSDPWEIQTQPYGEVFVSPQRRANGKERKRRIGPSYMNYMGATPYGGSPGIRSSWRPNNVLPIKTHIRLGGLLQRLELFSLPRRAADKLNAQRHYLDEWVHNEYRHRADGLDDLSRVYFPQKYSTFRTRGDALRGVEEARELLVGGYNDCKPRQKLIDVLNEIADSLKPEQKTV